MGSGGCLQSINLSCRALGGGGHPPEVSGLTPERPCRWCVWRSRVPTNVGVRCWQRRGSWSIVFLKDICKISPIPQALLEPWQSHVPGRTFCLIPSKLGGLQLSWPMEYGASDTKPFWARVREVPCTRVLFPPGTHAWGLATTLGERPGFMQILMSKSHFSRPVLSLQQKVNIWWRQWWRQLTIRLTFMWTS